MHVLLPDTFSDGNGFGPALELNWLQRKLLVLTLGVIQMGESSRLLLSMWGSQNGVDWGATAVASFRWISYTGQYAMVLNLASRPDVQYLRAQWHLRKYGETGDKQQSGFHVLLECSRACLDEAAA